MLAGLFLTRMASGNHLQWHITTMACLPCRLLAVLGGPMATTGMRHDVLRWSYAAAFSVERPVVNDKAARPPLT